MLGFASQEAGAQWRKRFSEDLVQVLNQMGDWCWIDVDLLLRDLESGRVVEREDVRLEGQHRRRIWQDRYAWPFRAAVGSVGRWGVAYEGKDWVLVSLEGVETSELEPFHEDADLETDDLYDILVDATGDSPPARIDFVLRDPATGETRSLEDVERAAPR